MFHAEVFKASDAGIVLIVAAETIRERRAFLETVLVAEAFHIVEQIITRESTIYVACYCYEIYK